MTRLLFPQKAENPLNAILKIKIRQYYKATIAYCLFLKGQLCNKDIVATSLKAITVLAQHADETQIHRYIEYSVYTLNLILMGSTSEALNFIILFAHLTQLTCNIMPKTAQLF